MRIGIYTQPLRFNYGGLLQAWALQVVLRRMGHDVITFDPCPYKSLSWKRLPFAYAKRTFRRLMGNDVCIFHEKKVNRDFDVKFQNLHSFVDTNIQRREFKNVKDILPSDYDVLIAGSDQVWRPQYNISYGRSIENAFFDFACDWNVKRIAYAASFGTDDWEFSHEQTERCSKLAALFSAISVREVSGIKLCMDHLGVNAVHVLDPTMLLSRDDYVALIQKGANTKSPKGNLLCYILDETPETNLLVHEVATSRRLVPFRANFIKKNAIVEDQIQPPVEQWLRNFHDAEFVLTDSFHACVFSIIFDKPFIVIANEKRGKSRYDSLFEVLNISNHLIHTASDYDSGLDYIVPQKSHGRLTALRMYSMDFLEKALNN